MSNLAVTAWPQIDGALEMSNTGNELTNVLVTGENIFIFKRLLMRKFRFRSKLIPLSDVTLVMLENLISKQSRRARYFSSLTSEENKTYQLNFNH